MSKNQYPTLLNKKATMLGSLTRTDLLIVGVFYLLLSWMKVSGLYALVIIAIVVLLLKVVKKKIPKGFLIHLNDEEKLPWSFKLRGENE